MSFLSFLCVKAFLKFEWKLIRFLDSTRIQFELIPRSDNNGYQIIFFCCIFFHFLFIFFEFFHRKIQCEKIVVCESGTIKIPSRTDLARKVRECTITIYWLMTHRVQSVDLLSSLIVSFLAFGIILSKNSFLFFFDKAEKILIKIVKSIKTSVCF